jgi:hypothetical protein
MPDYKARAANDSEYPDDALTKHLNAVLTQADERRGVVQAGEEPESKKDTGEIKPGERDTAERLIRDIGLEFNRLRKKGRSAAWADLEDRVAASGHVLISTGMISAKDWVGMMIDIEQFRKAEGGSEELPGDALAKWLSEAEPKQKKVKAN